MSVEMVAYCAPRVATGFAFDKTPDGWHIVVHRCFEALLVVGVAAAAEGMYVGKLQHLDA